MTKPVTSRAKLQGKDLAAFKNEYDPDTIVPGKIKAALAELGDAWTSEVDFCRAAGIAGHVLARYRDVFTGFWVEMGGRNPKRLWAGTKTFAAKMRESLT